MRGSGMEPQRAARELRKLRDQADSPEIQRSGPQHKSWKAKVDAVMQGGLGHDSETLREFRDLRYGNGFYTGAPGEADKDARFFAERVGDAAGLIDAAIYELELEASIGEGSHVTPTGPIIVVHGHDGARKHELMRLLDRTIDLQAIVLHEQPNKGATILASPRAMVA